MTERRVVGRIYAGLGLLLGGKAAAGLISLAYLMIAARSLGPVDYGLLVLAHGYVTTVCGIVEFPAWQAIVRFGAIAHAEHAPHRLARLLRLAAILELSAGVLAILVAIGLAPVIGPHLGWPDQVIAFMIPYSFAVLGSIRSTPAGYLQLVGRFDLLGIHSLVAPITRLIGAIVAWFFVFGLKGFFVSWLVASLVEWTSLWSIGLWLARRELGSTLARPEPGRIAADNPGIWRFLIASNADTTLGELSGRIAPLIIGSAVGPAAAGLFAIAQRATVVIAQPAQILGTAAYAELSRLVATGRQGRPLRRALIKIIGLAVLASLPVLLIVSLFSTRIVYLIAGGAYLGAAAAVGWLMFARVVMLAGPPCSAALSALGRPELSMTANMVASLLFLPALPLLLAQYGLIGAAYQTVLQGGFTSALIAVLVWRLSHAADR